MRRFKVVFEFLNEHGHWMPDYLDGNGHGFCFREADMIAADLRATISGTYGLNRPSLTERSRHD